MKQLLTILFLIIPGLIQSQVYYARRDGNWNAIGTWSLLAPGGLTCGCIPTPGSDVIINGYDVTLQGVNPNINSLEISNSYSATSGKNAKLEIDSKILTVANDIVMIAANVDEDTELEIVGTGQLIGNGNFTATRTADNVSKKKASIKLDDNAIMSVGNFTFDYLNAGKEVGDEIEVKSDALLEINGDMILHMVSGEKFLVDLKNNGLMTVKGTTTMDVEGGKEFTYKVSAAASFSFAYNTEVLLKGGKDYNMQYSSSATSTIDGEFLLNKSGGTNLLVSLTGGTSRLNVTGNLTMVNSENADLLKVQLSGNTAILDVDGSIDYLGAMTQGVVEVEINNSSTLKLAGDILRNSPPNDFGLMEFNNNASIEFNGTNAQTIAYTVGAGTDEIGYLNVIINNTAVTAPQLSTNGVVSIDGTITFTNGITLAKDINYIVLENGANCSGASDISHIDGYIRKMGNAPAVNFPFAMPVGNNGFYAPIYIGSPGNTSDGYEAAYFNRNPSIDNYFVTSKDPAINNISIKEYWILNRIAGTSDVPVSLSWEDSRSGGITNLAELTVAWWNGTRWIDKGNGGTTGDVTAGTVVTAAPATGYGVFTLGSTGSANPLPVTLVNFNAALLNNSVNISWETASEERAEHFLIERSSNAVEWDVVLRVDAQGAPLQHTEYFEQDHEPLSGISYYRLRQYDTDGNMTKSNIVKIDNNPEESNWTLNVYPNPSNGENIFIEMNSNASGEILLVIMDASGKIVFTDGKVNLENGVVNINSLNLAAGTYAIVASSNDKLASKTLVVR